jgi:hypothetical protein
MAFQPGQILTAALLNTLFDKIMGDPTATSSAGTTTVGATETLDAVLSTYAFTAVAGRRYRATLSGCLMSGTIANIYALRIRDGGASTPTAASTLIAETRWFCPATGGAGQCGIPSLSGTFTPSAGTRTLGVFCHNPSGVAGIPIGSRELYVEDIGAA